MRFIYTTQPQNKQQPARITTFKFYIAHYFSFVSICYFADGVEVSFILMSVLWGNLEDLQ